MLVERFEVISAEEHQTPYVLQQLLVVQPIQEDRMNSFIRGFFKGIWLVVKWFMILTIMIGIGLFILGVVL